MGAQRGHLSGSPPAFTPYKGSKTWNLDELGNWREVDTFNGSGYAPETRSHNNANELTHSTAFGGLYRFYDACGNLIVLATTSSGSLGQRQQLTYDAWGRLVRAQNLRIGGDQDTGEYQYNALH